MVSSDNAWAETTLNFRSLLEAANADWIEEAGPDGPTWQRKSQTDVNSGWVGGGGLESNLGTALFGALTSSNDATGGEIFNVAFTGADSWVQGVNPHLFIHEQVPGAGAQTRFAMRENATYTAPQIIIDFTPVPEPSIALLVGLGLLRRRRA